MSITGFPLQCFLSMDAEVLEGEEKMKRYFLSWYKEKGKHHISYEAVLAAGKEAVQRAE